MTTAADAPPSFAASMEQNLPPDYNEPSSRAAQRPRHSLVQRDYALETSGKPWAVLKLNCRPGSATSLPFFIQGEPITGTVELNLKNTEHIEAITIEVRGEETAAGRLPTIFLTQVTTLWSTRMGNPGLRDSSIGSAKLKGDYVWPFSLTLPDKVTVSAKGRTSEHSLPPTFQDRASPDYLGYRLLVTFHRGKIRADHVIFAPFAYLSHTSTPAPSTLRQLAYRENSSPPGPKGDPEGWEVLGPKSIVGTVFASRQVEVSCLLALAKPLCYTLGTFVPFILTLSCSDPQALDLFAAQGSLDLCLMRSLKFRVHDTGESRPKDTIIQRVGRGVYWLGGENSTSSETRSLEGEIPVGRRLKHSFEFSRLCLDYYVSFALKAPGFTPSSEDKHEPTFSREVVITTGTAPGPPPRSRVPPALKAQEVVQEEDVADGFNSLARNLYTKGSF